MKIPKILLMIRIKTVVFNQNGQHQRLHLQIVVIHHKTQTEENELYSKNHKYSQQCT